MRKLLLCFLISICSCALAYANNTNTNNYVPYVYLSGFAGSGVIGTGDVLAPVWQQADRNFFFYGQGSYGVADEDWLDNPWSGSAGFGYRQIGNNAVYGLFVLGDYNRTDSNHSVLQVSPGVEILGRVWELHINGYIPVQDKDWVTQGWADNFGNYDYITFNGHNQHDAWFTYNEEVGGGADAELGRTLFKVNNTVVSGFVNGYFFHMDHNKNIRGGGASIDVQPTSYLKLTAKGSYDNYAHTQVVVGFQVSLHDLFGNTKVANPLDLQRKLYNPIDRNFGNIASGSTTRTAGGPGNGTPEVNEWYNHDAPERTNVWFFNGSNVALSASGVGSQLDIEDGTYEYPFHGSEFNQATVNNIANYTAANGYAQAYLYFTQGNYSALGLPIPGLVGGNPINIQADLSLWGRIGADNGFQEPATGNSRALFTGSLQLDSNTSINNIRLQNASMFKFDTGVLLNGATNVGINDSQVGVDSPIGSYVTGVTMKNSTDLTISGSYVYGYSDASANYDPFVPDSVGLAVQNGGNVTAINGSLIEGHSVNNLSAGLYAMPTTDAAGNVDSRIGNIIGDKSALFYGDSDKWLGYGFYARSDVYDSAAAATTEIGNIWNSNFTGVSNDGYAGVGFSAISYSSSNVSNAGQATLNIGNIWGSKFTGSSIGEGIGFMAYSYSMSGFGSSGDATVQIGNIVESSFNATAVNADSYGFYTFSDSMGHSGFSGNTTLRIGNIFGSKFTSNSDIEAYGVWVDSRSSVAAGNSGSAKLDVGNIGCSSFSGYGGIDKGYGFYADMYSRVLVSGTPGSSALHIGDIYDSYFKGVSKDRHGIGLFLFNDGDRFQRSGASGMASITIGNIDNSNFIGIGKDGPGYGFELFNGSLSTIGAAGSASVNIGNIYNSNFIGIGKGGPGYGFYLFNQSKSTAGTSDWSSVQIGNITDSSFKGFGKSSSGYGFYLDNDGSTNSWIKLGAVYGNNFNASSTGFNVKLPYGSFEANGMSYSDADSLYNYLSKHNTFSGDLTKGKICYNGICEL